jgi:hypothetical protein
VKPVCFVLTLVVAARCKVFRSAPCIENVCGRYGSMQSWHRQSKWEGFNLHVPTFVSPCNRLFCLLYRRPPRNQSWGWEHKISVISRNRAQIRRSSSSLDRQLFCSCIVPLYFHLIPFRCTKSLFANHIGTGKRTLPSFLPVLWQLSVNLSSFLAPLYRNDAWDVTTDYAHNSCGVCSLYRFTRILNYGALSEALCALKFKCYSTLRRSRNYTKI